MVANHLSYLDILVLSAINPVVFVAKSEVGGWPVFGWMARLAGTVLVRRDRIRHLPRVIGEMRQILAAGLPVVLFPEGTTMNGSFVLPFRSALFQSAVTDRVPVTPVALNYANTGDASFEVCWWGEMTLLPHLIKLLSKAQIHARVWICPAPYVWRNRKTAAIFTREQVVAMKVLMSDKCSTSVAIESEGHAALEVATESSLG